MRSLALAFLVVLAVTCGPSPDAKLPGYVGSNGGSVTPSRGGSTETGGTTANGGSVSAGGTSGVGGASASGGTKAAGGAVASGGVAGVGGVAAGGTPSTGGATAAGGAMAIDASPPPPAGDGGNCISRIINNGYACGTTATACSACKENNTSLEAKCKAVLDCFELKHPCTGNCATQCFNSAGASGPAQACVNALQTAACTGAGSC